jgi:hypothetical protein
LRVLNPRRRAAANACSNASTVSMNRPSLDSYKKSQAAD